MGSSVPEAVVLKAGGRDQISLEAGVPSQAGRTALQGLEERLSEAQEPRRDAEAPSWAHPRGWGFGTRAQGQKPFVEAGPLTLLSAGPPSGPGLGWRHTAASWEGNGKVRRRAGQGPRLAGQGPRRSHMVGGRGEFGSGHFLSPPSTNRPGSDFILSKCISQREKHPIVPDDFYPHPSPRRPGLRGP